MAIAHITGDSRSYVITEEGRNEEEKAFVLIENGVYRGFGYLERSEQFTSTHLYRESIILQQDNRDVQRIIQGFRSKNQDKFRELRH